MGGSGQTITLSQVLCKGVFQIMSLCIQEPFIKPLILNLTSLALVVNFSSLFCIIPTEEQSLVFPTEGDESQIKKKKKKCIWVDLVSGAIVALIVKFIQPCLLKMQCCRELFEGDGRGTKHRTRN